jgi:hypothetical protein
MGSGVFWVAITFEFEAGFYGSGGYFVGRRFGLGLAVRGEKSAVFAKVKKRAPLQRR